MNVLCPTRISNSINLILHLLHTLSVLLGWLKGRRPRTRLIKNPHHVSYPAPSAKQKVLTIPLYRTQGIIAFLYSQGLAAPSARIFSKLPGSMLTMEASSVRINSIALCR
jgi:hypothetical protein